MKKIALDYIRYGLSAIPASKPQKRPTLAGWKEFQKRLPNENDWAQWNGDGLCIVCGAVSGNLLMIDFDQAGKAFESYKKEVPSELLKRLVIERSQSGGVHLIVRSTGPVGKNQRLASDAEKKVLIETRGEGGLFLCDPTPGYKLIQGSFASISTLSETEIISLLESARSLDESNAPSPKQPSICSVPIRTDSDRPGDDFNHRGRALIQSLLQKHGWAFVKMDGINEMWRRPGKSAGHSASLHTELPLFHVFSSNAVPFEPKGYSFFDVYAIMEHNGDHRAAAKQLAADGYGDTFLGEPVELPEFILRPPDAPSLGEPPKQAANPNLGNPGKFPEHLLNVPGYVSTLAKFINDTSFVPQPVLALAASLSFQAMLCSQMVKCPLGARPNINILGIGRSSSGKERGRQVIKEILTALGNRPDKLYDPHRYFFEDAASYQALIKKLESNGGVMIWLWDEIGKILPSLRNDRTSHLSGILPVIMRLYTSANTVFVPHIRANSDDNLPTIQQPHLILFGTSVPRNVLEGFTVESLTDGLMGRLLFFEGDDDADDRDDLDEIPPVSEAVLEGAHWWLTKRMERINPDIPAPKVVPVDAEARKIFDAMRETKRKARAEHDDVKLALWGRAVEQARQLALVYASSRDRENPTIDKDAADWACKLVTYLIRRKIYLATKYVADEEFDRRQKEVLRYIESCGGKCTRTMLFRRFKNWEKRKREDVIDNLFETESVYFVEDKQEKGRPISYINVVQE